MLEFIAKARTPIHIIRSLSGICLLATMITWVGFQSGIDHTLFRSGAIWFTIGYMALLIAFASRESFTLNVNAVKPIMTLLLVINLSAWSNSGFMFWTNIFSLLAIVYVLFRLFDKYFSKIVYTLTVDKKREIQFEPYDVDYAGNYILTNHHDVEKRAIRAVVNTFKSPYRYNDKVYAYEVKTSMNTNGNRDITIDFALNSKPGKPAIRLFDVILSYSDD